VAMTGPGHDALRHVLLQAAHDPAAIASEAPIFRQKVEAVAGEDLAKLMALAHVRTAPPVRNTEDLTLARMCLADELAKLDARRGAVAETEEAMEIMTGLVDEGLTWRLGQANDARHRARKSKLDDDSDLGEDRAKLSAELQRLIDTEVWLKKKS
jgi:DNA primase